METPFPPLGRLHVTVLASIALGVATPVAAQAPLDWASLSEPVATPWYPRALDAQTSLPIAQIPGQPRRPSPAQLRAIGLGMGIGALAGLVVGFVTMPDDCGLGCVARPAAYTVGGAAVGIVGGLTVAIFLGDANGDSSPDVGLRLAASWW